MPQPAELSVPSANVAWVYFAQGFLFRSTDRGGTWEQRPLPVSRPGVGPEISFVDDQNGWYSTSGSPETQCNGQLAAIWRTTDGGATWQLLNTAGISTSQCKEGLSFVDPTHGFLAAWDDNHRPTIYRTADGGKSWAGATLPDPPGSATQGGGVALRAGLVRSFGSTLLVSALGNQAAPYVFRSTDGGATWGAIAQGALSGANDIVFVTASRWLQLIAIDQSLETTDSGRTWHPYSTDYSQAAPIAPLIVFGDSLIGFATVRGSIQRTVDGGFHWVVIQTPGTRAPAPSPSPPAAASSSSCHAQANPAPSAGWLTFSSASWCYSVAYPAAWYDLSTLGAPDTEQYFSNEKVGAPLSLTGAGIFLGLSAVPGECPTPGAYYRVDGQAALDVDGQAVSRTYGYLAPPQSETAWMIYAAIPHGATCYTFRFITLAQAARDHNVAIADKMIASFRSS